MDESEVIRFLSALEGVEVVAASGDHYFFYDPDRVLPHDRRLPFATVVTGDRHDRVSNLDRPSVFRVNVGVARETYRARFGPPPAFNREGDGVVDTGHDYAALDRIMPHPVYAPMSWVCVLNPGEATAQELRRLLIEAHGL